MTQDEVREESRNLIIVDQVQDLGLYLNKNETALRGFKQEHDIKHLSS